MFVRSNEKNYLFLGVWLFVEYWKKKKHMELKLAKLKFHITRNSSLGSLSTIEEKKDNNTLKFVFTKNSSLGRLSIVLHGARGYQARVPCGIFSIKKSTSAQVFLWNLSV